MQCLVIPLHNSLERCTILAVLQSLLVILDTVKGDELLQGELTLPVHLYEVGNKLCSLLAQGSGVTLVI